MNGEQQQTHELWAAGDSLASQQPGVLRKCALKILVTWLVAGSLLEQLGTKHTLPLHTASFRQTSAAAALQGH